MILFVSKTVTAEGRKEKVFCSDKKGLRCIHSRPFLLLMRLDFSFVDTHTKSGMMASEVHSD